MAKDVGRNDPCPCGSGAKYKYCCLRRSGRKSGTRQAIKPQQTERKNAEKSTEELKYRVTKKFERQGAKQVSFRKNYATEVGKKPNSDVLLEFAEPLLEHDRPQRADVLEECLELAMSIWNALCAQNTEEYRQSFISTFSVDPTLQPAELWDELAERKARLFPDDDRHFAEVMVRDEPGGPYVEVAAVFPVESVEDLPSGDKHTGE